MPFRINHAILHIIDRKGEAMLSNHELDIDSETCSQFVEKHVKKLLKHPGASEASFIAESSVYSLAASYIRQEIFFGDMSRNLCERLADILLPAEDALPADILIADFEDSKNRYLALVKLNYMECFTHKLAEGDNQLAINSTILPFTNGKVEEACLIPFEPMVLRVLEKPCVIAGKEINYMSRLFLECETEMSKKETAEIIGQAAEEIIQKHFDGDKEAVARFSRAIIEEAEKAEFDGDELQIENVLSEAFGENEEARGEFLALTKESGLPSGVRLDKAFARRQFGTQKFKSDNGIEIKFPTELLEQPDVLQFATNQDGSVSISLKNLRPADA